MSKQDIIDVLEELSSDQFSKFQWHLQQDPEITTSRIERAGPDRRKTVDCMVQTFPDNAVKITADLLKKISRNDLANKLPHTWSRPKAPLVKTKSVDDCPVCLELFAEPVSLPCEHKFCKACITKYWDDSELCQCPMCKCSFSSRPELRKRGQPAGSGEVFCCVCIDSQVEAVKSCLDCNMSFCETHLEPHHTVPALSKHQLLHPVKNLEDRMCKKHNKLLEFFCRDDKKCICSQCSYTYHKNHNVVNSQDECAMRRRQMGDERRRLDKLIQERQRKMRELYRSEKSSEEEAEKEKEDCNEAYSALVETIRKNRAEVIEVIEKKQREVREVLHDFIEELRAELDDLLWRKSEIEELSHNEDRLYVLLHNNDARRTSPTTTKDWSEVGINSEIHVGMASEALAEMDKHLNTEMEMLFKDMQMINHDLVDNLEMIQQLCAVDVLLDPDTANPYLIVAEDGTQVRAGEKKHRVTTNPKRFGVTLNVLGRQGFSSGRFYYEVEVKRKTGWTLGVAKESVDRNGTTANTQDGYWTIGLVDGKYKCSDNTDVSISHGRMPVKIGVFADHAKGKVSFYDVEGRAVIYSFTGCSFTEKIYPVFNPFTNHNGINGSPLIITLSQSVSPLQPLPHSIPSSHSPSYSPVSTPSSALQCHAQSTPVTTPLINLLTIKLDSFHTHTAKTYFVATLICLGLFLLLVFVLL